MSASHENNEKRAKNGSYSIQVLPQEVIDRIKAGEVVQRPSSAIKELLENALDAGSTEIIVTVLGRNLQNLTVRDNGCGIAKDDLPRAVQRHATSKLHSTEDLHKLTTFGFRGEALASMAAVAHVTLTSRKNDEKVGYQYHHPTQKTRPTARTEGTTVLLENLFHNLPQRQRTSASDYNNILKAVQHYAIPYAAAGVAFVCQLTTTSARGKKSEKVDLNTRASTRTLGSNKLRVQEQLLTNEPYSTHQLAAIKQVISQIYGSATVTSLEPFHSQLTGTESTQARASLEKKTSRQPRYNGYDFGCFQEEEEDHRFQQLQSSSPIYSCNGLVSLPSAMDPGQKRTHFVLFCNLRWIECPPLKRRLEDLYATMSGINKRGKPFIFLSLLVPPEHVDVNIHPTKQQITLLHFDAIAEHLEQVIRKLFEDHGQSFTVSNKAQEAISKEEGKAVNDSKESDHEDENIVVEQSTAPKPTDEEGVKGPKLPENESKPIVNPYKRANVDTVAGSKTKVAPNKKVRTSRSTPAGALEPYLVPTQSLTQSKSLGDRDGSESSSSNPPSQETGTMELSRDSPDLQQHLPDCPFLRSTGSSVDLSKPGAFATAAAECTCRRRRQETLDSFALYVPRKAILRPKKVMPTETNLTSILSLRHRVEKKSSKELQKKLRSACFVGVVSHQRSLIQCEKELVLMNHFEAAKALFYQLALHRFDGGTAVAKLGDIDVVSVIADCVQMEDYLQHIDEEASDVEIEASSATAEPSLVSLKISETNQALAEQAAECLMEHAEMLGEYFSMKFERDNVSKKIKLTGLPVLLDGFEPLVDGLPLFLLRLATEVDWTAEKPCFHGVCQELGSFYAQLPHKQDDLGKYVQHILFPAITTLLVPPEKTRKDSFVTMTDLQKLYRIFERC